MKTSNIIAMPVAQTRSGSDYKRVEAAIAYLMARRDPAPSLDELARRAGLSPFHFQRLFKRWAGVSPKQFLSYVSVEHAKASLESDAPVLAAAWDAGLSGSSRLHDQFVSVAAMTPGEYKVSGRDLIIRYSMPETPFGRALVLSTDRGICGIEFTDEKETVAVSEAKDKWPLSTFIKETENPDRLVRRIFHDRNNGRNGQPQQLLLRGTNFQIQVWSALLRIPEGHIASYGGIARALGKPSASRAVGTALAANTIAYLIPCHRVLRATGLFKSYRWGAPRRWAMLGWEAVRAETQMTNIRSSTRVG